MFGLTAPNAINGSATFFTIGKSASSYNRFSFVYNHIADGSTSNYFSIGAYSANGLLNILANGNVGIAETAPDYKLDVNGSFGFTPGSSVTPVDNGDVTISATDNTTLTFRLKGSDGTVRSGTLTLS
jgi:hypothetical protein